MKGRNFTTHRLECLDQSILLFTLGIIWLISSAIGLTKFLSLAILIFLIGNTLIGAIVSAMRKTFNLTHNPTEKYSMAMSCLTIGIVLGLIIVFFPFIENPNVFFPAFGLIQGVFFGISAQVTGNKTYWSVSFAMILTAVFGWFNFLNSFAPTGLIISAIFIAGSLSLRIVVELSKLTLETGRRAKGVQLEKIKA